MSAERDAFAGALGRFATAYVGKVTPGDMADLLTFAAVQVRIQHGNEARHEAVEAVIEAAREEARQ